MTTEQRRHGRTFVAVQRVWYSYWVHVSSLVERRTQDRGIPTVIENRDSRDDDGLRSGGRYESGGFFGQSMMTLTTAEHPPATAQPIRCASQWRLPEVQNDDWSTAWVLSDGQDILVAIKWWGRKKKL